MPLDIDEDETCYNKCKYYIKRTCLATTIIINFLFFIKFIYNITKYSNYFDKIFGFGFLLLKLFLYSLSLICWYII